MKAPPWDSHAGRAEFLSRRRLLWLAGTAGVVATASACSSRTAEQSAATPATGPIDDPTAAVGPSASLTTAPPPTHSPAASTTSAVLLCREAWGAHPARPGGRPHTITRMTVHHTAVALGDNRDAAGRLREHQRYHQDELGWIDIAYHVGVDRNGNIYELRTPTLAGDTATNYDPASHFLVVCEGNFDDEDITEAQLNGAATAFAWAAQKFDIATDTLAGHRDVAATACPGANLYNHVASGELKRRIDSLLSAGTVELRAVCGTEAAAIVADDH